jgi:protoporphyrinogen oxidase
MPVDELVYRSDLDDLKPAAAKLRHSATHVIGVGLKGGPGVHLEKKCWMYFPETDTPFYRVTVFSNYSPNNVPDASRFWSLMLEVSESPVKPVFCEKLSEHVLDGLVASHLIENVRDVVSMWHFRAEHGYPTPSLQRNGALNALLPALEKHGIFSRGRFGAWKYEVSNQDHAVMQGVELINRLANGGGEYEECTLNMPGLVNGRRAASAKG